MTLSTGVVNGALMGYTSQGRNVYLTNLETGNRTPLELHGLSSQVAGFDALKYSPLDGYLYTVGRWSNPVGFGSYNLWCHLYRIDVQSGEVMSWPEIFDKGTRGYLGIDDLALAPSGTLYALDDPYPGLIEIDVETYELTGRDYPGGGGVMDAFAIDGSGTGWMGIDNMLYEYDLAGNTLLFKGQFDQSFTFRAFDFADDGTLYGLVSTGHLYRIDNENTIATHIGNPGTAYAFTIIPEPCTLSLLALGGLVLRRRRKWYS